MSQETQSEVAVKRFIGLAAAGLASLCISAVAVAQTVAPAQLDAVRLDLARQLFAASGGSEQAQLIVKAMYGQSNKILSQALPSDSTGMAARIRADVEDELISIVPQILDISARVFANNLTEKELQDQLAWIRSESGQSIQRKMPAVTAQLIQAETPLIAAMMPKVMQKALDRACEATKCTVQQRQTIAARMTAALDGKTS